MLQVAAFVLLVVVTASILLALSGSEAFTARDTSTPTMSTTVSPAPSVSGRRWCARRLLRGCGNGATPPGCASATARSGGNW